MHCPGSGYNACAPSPLRKYRSCVLGSTSLMSHYTNINGEVKGLVLIGDWALCSAVDCPLLIKFPAFPTCTSMTLIHVYTMPHPITDSFLVWRGIIGLFLSTPNPYWVPRRRFPFYRAMHFSAKRGIAIACRPSVCLSVRLSVCDVGGLWSHRLE